MSNVALCQDGVSAGGPALLRPSPTAHTVDVSMETLAASYQDHKTQHLSAYDGCSSPHLHRNQQLQETLQQREEELARLQQENDKLRHFLSSSLVRDLEEKVKGLRPDPRRDPRRDLKRSLQPPGPPPAPRNISKRVCRNLFPESCCDPAPPRTPDLDLDLWILRTLGLTDRDTIDPSPSSSRLLPPPPPCASPSSSRLPPPPPLCASPSSSRLLPPPPPSAYEAPAILPDLPLCLMTSLPARRDLTLSPGLRSPRPHSSKADAPPPRHDPDPGLPSPLTQGLGRTPGGGGVTPGPPGPGSGSASDPDPPGSLRATDAPWSVRLASPCTASIFQTSSGSRTLTPPPGGVPPVPTPPPTPGGQTEAVFRGPPTPGGQTEAVFRGPHTPGGQREAVFRGPHTPGGQTEAVFRGPHTPGGQREAVFRGPHTPGGQTEAVFRGPLSPSCSLRTHSFPQGQAFIRKDSQGHWGFTWLPKQEL